MKEKHYAEVVCNYLNNLKGYIEDYEIKNLLWCIFGLEDLETIEINFDDVMQLSSDICSDNQERFYYDLVKTKETILKTKGVI